jgi:hypothetical protein
MTVVTGLHGELDLGYIAIIQLGNHVH